MIFFIYHRNGIDMKIVSNNLARSRSPLDKLTIVKFPVIGRLIVQYKGKAMLLKTNDIIYCQASSNYTMIHMIDGRSILASKCLKEITKRLPESQFVRIHQSYLINLSFVAALGPDEIDLYDCPLSLPLSRRYKKSLRARFSSTY